MINLKKVPIQTPLFFTIISTSIGIKAWFYGLRTLQCMRKRSRMKWCQNLQIKAYVIYATMWDISKLDVLWIRKCKDDFEEKQEVNKWVKTETESDEVINKF